MFPKYYPKNRQPQDEKVIPLSLNRPLELRSNVVTSGRRDRGPVCVYELSLLLGCFKQSSFSQIACATEISNFEKCFYAAKKYTGDGKINRQIKKSKEDTSVKKEINKLLQKFN